MRRRVVHWAVPAATDAEPEPETAWPNAAPNSKPEATKPRTKPRAAEPGAAQAEADAGAKPGTRTRTAAESGAAGASAAADGGAPLSDDAGAHGERRSRESETLNRLKSANSTYKNPHITHTWPIVKNRAATGRLQLGKRWEASTRHRD